MFIPYCERFWGHKRYLGKAYFGIRKAKLKYTRITYIQPTAIDDKSEKLYLGKIEVKGFSLLKKGLTKRIVYANHMEEKHT